MFVYCALMNVLCLRCKQWYRRARCFRCRTGAAEHHRQAFSAVILRCKQSSTVVSLCVTMQAFQSRQFSLPSTLHMLEVAKPSTTFVQTLAFYTLPTAICSHLPRRSTHRSKGFLLLASIWLLALKHALLQAPSLGCCW